ncbi:hypothetical protein MMC20_003805 [Loxospora ochrophaea]|nr:hypothetical protein [Loxospora ochrophaea]
MSLKTSLTTSVYNGTESYVMRKRGGSGTGSIWRRSSPASQIIRGICQRRGRPEPYRRPDKVSVEFSKPRDSGSIVMNSEGEAAGLNLVDGIIAKNAQALIGGAIVQNGRNPLVENMVVHSAYDSLLYGNTMGLHGKPSIDWQIPTTESNLQRISLWHQSLRRQCQETSRDSQRVLEPSCSFPSLPSLGLRRNEFIGRNAACEVVASCRDDVQHSDTMAALYLDGSVGKRYN